MGKLPQDISVIKNQCRLCSSRDLISICILPGFPKAAQFFINSDLSNLSEDASVTLEVMQCKSCSLVQLMNDPVWYFRDVITAASLSEASKAKLASEWMPFIEKYELCGKSSIEIGSGRGDFLEVLKRLELSTYGLEHSAENIKYCLEKGLQVSQGYLIDCGLTKKYSLVVCNNFLEHQPNTGEFIKSLAKLLDKDGILYLSVPNFEYLLAKNCLYEFVADHLVYFTQESLRIACEMNGLDVLEGYQKNNGNDVVVVCKKRAPIDITKSVEVVGEIMQSLVECVKKNQSQGKRVAVWGAGHRALALMSIANLDAIEFVIDSADFKQGKLTPRLHKKIISPQEFLHSGCECVIVMLPGSYASQVVDFIKLNQIECEVIIFEDKKLIN